MDEIKYVMWNRAVDKFQVEVCFYTEDWKRIKKEIILKEDWSELPYIPVSPMEVFQNTNGNMGVEKGDDLK